MHPFLYLFFVLCLCNCNLCSRYISDNELKDYSEDLLAKDQNNVAKYVSLNLQSKTKSDQLVDVAPQKLFSVSKQAYDVRTIAKILPLYDNYDADSAHNEVVTRVEKQEESSLLDTLLSTDVIAHIKQILQSKEIAPKGDNNFRNFMSDLWFTLFSRGGRKVGSSAFEHIFLGEFKKNQVSGLHNWIFFDHEETKGHINYMGWIRKLDFSQNKGSIIKLRYSWNNVTKPVGTMFVGTSPEFELALYTICFFARPNDRCNLSVGGKSFFIQTYSFNYNNKTLISSAYPGL